MRETTQCPICLGEETVLFLDRAHVPVHQNLLMSTAEAARAIPQGSLRMRCCESCGFVFNAAFDPSLLSYGSDYENTQTCSPLVEQYVDKLCEQIIDQAGSGATIVEIGCGKGFFLRKLLELDRDARGIGFDPSYAGDLVSMDGRLRFERRFYDASAATVHADVVICRHVIEHVERPLELLQATRAAINSPSTARVYFETPDVDWIFKNGVAWDFFFEHCSLFNAGSLRTAFQNCRFEVTGVDNIFGEQYLWLEAVPASRPSLTEMHPGETAGLARDFGRLEQRLLSQWREQLTRWADVGPVVLWGAGAKGVTYAALLDPDRKLLSALVDVNAAKQGHFVPGTAHRIVGPRHLLEIKPTAVIVLNPNYVPEIEEAVGRMGLSSRIIDLTRLVNAHQER